MQHVAGKPDCGSRIPLRGLRDNLPLRHFRQLPRDLFAQMIEIRSGGKSGRKRSMVCWIKLRSPKKFSTCLAFALRLRGQNRVPRPPARMRP
jgi:hypothetical protein